MTGSMDSGKDPTSDDLSTVLRRLMDRASSTRSTREARVRLANDEKTRAFLEGGMQLVSAQLTIFDPSLSDNEDSDQTESKRPFFAWLSRERVVQQTREQTGQPWPNPGSFRDRWRFQHQFIDDLLAYALWARHWNQNIEIATDSHSLLAAETDFVSAIQQVAYRDLCLLVDSPAYKVSMIAIVSSGGDPDILLAARSVYTSVGIAWANLYKATIEARGLRLRPGVTYGDLSTMLTAFAEGIALRIIADADNRELIDHDKRLSLLGKAGMALAVSCIDAGDGRSLEELVRAF